ncbi:hypothetical protein FEM48_Zijuj08G0121400 [Ziziphus jujuba var. spinosa]|uniref:Soyasapogenol B glucuronide galactosyltransferase-like n=1 Tax=Ziziphus jujuba var. spinosa TaxID=714518 RepID=A0A978UZ06_ZIZJJ|nr:hypothetical protein FEM48_Zijuj08G0121400 [Ziziphus jujuba var. spinosa]
MIPMVEEARVFAKHGVDVTIILTPANAALFWNNIDRDFNSGRLIRIHTFPFPSAEVGLPDGIENFNNITSMEMTRALAHALQLLRKPIEQLFHDMRPDCIVTDTFYPWTLDVANKLGIPRLGFRGSSYISLCAEYCIKKYETHKSTESDVVLIPGLPHNVEMMISKIPDWMITTKDFTHRMDFLRDCEQKSYGMLMNSFHDLENDFEDHFNSMGYKAWSIGPVSLWVNKDATHKADRYNINSGHMIPMVEEARLFAKHGVDVTVIITQANAALIHNNIDRDFRAGHRIRTHAIRFPSAEVGLPEGIESLSTITSMEMMGSIRQALKILQQTIEQLLYDGRPDCIVADMFYPWTLEVANKLGIPRLAFRGCSYFSLCAEYYVRVCEPHKHCSVDSNYDVVSLRGLPHKIDMLMSQLPDWSRKVTDFTDFMEVMTGAEEKSYGMLMNSFSELESDYEEYFKTTMGLRAWSVGPISLWVNKNVPDKAQSFTLEKNKRTVVAYCGLTHSPSFVWVALKKNKVVPEALDQRLSGSKTGLMVHADSFKWGCFCRAYRYTVVRIAVEVIKKQEQLIPKASRLKNQSVNDTSKCLTRGTSIGFRASEFRMVKKEEVYKAVRQLSR